MGPGWEQQWGCAGLRGCARVCIRVCVHEQGSVQCLWVHAFACAAHTRLCTDDAVRARVRAALCSPYVCARARVQGSSQHGACTRVCVCAALQCCTRARTCGALLSAPGTRGALCGATRVQGSAQPRRYVRVVCTHSYACVLPWHGAEPGSPGQAAAGRRGRAEPCPRPDPAAGSRAWAVGWDHGLRSPWGSPRGPTHPGSAGHAVPLAALPSLRAPGTCLPLCQVA